MKRGAIARRKRGRLVSRKQRRATTRPIVDIGVVWADISRAAGDLFVVGHYQGVLPQNAEWALDRALSATRKEHELILTDFTKRGVIRGALGDISFFPWGRERSIVVAGMGRPGTFHAPELRRLVQSVSSSIGRLLDKPTVCTVLIGSGAGNLEIPDCVSGLLLGLGDVLSTDQTLRIGPIRIVEQSLDRAVEILDELKSAVARDEMKALARWRVGARLAEERGGQIPDSFGYSMVLAAVARAAGLPERSKTRRLLEDILRKLPRGEIRQRITTGLLQANRRSKAFRKLALQFRLAERKNNKPEVRVPIRMSFHSDGDTISSSAITNAVTVVERKLGASFTAIERAVERLQAPAPDKAERYGQGLARRLIHSDFISLFEDSGPLVIELDRPMARVQWEMLLRGPEQSEPVGIRRAVARQLRTFYSPRPADVAQRPTLRALVIGDPGDEALGESLPHARKEALAVASLLRQRGVDVSVLIGAPVLGKGPIDGVFPADLSEVVDLLLSGDFDLVHYTGHSTWEPSLPGRAGWVFRDGLLTAGDLDGMERPPMLVLANACRSAELSATSKAGPANTSVGPTGVAVSSDDAGIVAGLADEFFRRGVADYIGTSWEVPSVPATLFAKVFYEACLPRQRGTRGAGEKQTLGEAVRLARKALYDGRKKLGEYGSVWGAYQHYGDPTRELEVPAHR